MSAISILRPDHQHPHMVGYSDWIAIGETETDFVREEGNDNRWRHWTNLDSSILEPMEVGTVINGYIIWSRDNKDRTTVTVTKVNRKSWKCIAEDDGKEYVIHMN